MNLQDIHTFFVDDEPDVRAAVQRALASSGMQVSVFPSAEECLTALSQQACDAVVTDVRLEGMDGISLLQTIRRRFPWLPVILTTGYGDIPLAVAAMKAGAADFLEKPLDREQLLSTVQSALTAATRPQPSLHNGLSDTEAYVLRLVLNGKTSKEIAGALKRSIRTIESHRHRIMRKFGARNIAQLVERANAIGLGKSGTTAGDAEDCR